MNYINKDKTEQYFIIRTNSFEQNNKEVKRLIFH